ncbi:hypothetical protein POM88_034632 [Heracleum sosnowskyi]|uniref:Uncharacterized protein n=1 Tax=Heracleum sosnowskyi TaxID=360622 RepID=A0AAD8HJM3_9APIA|nr:hypothetical protein POM88_034632 [Heracleum sosnowskyi]
MAPKQTLSQTNFASIFSPNDAGEGFKGLVFFLNKSYLGYAITSTPILDLDRLEAFWQTAVAQTEGENPDIQFTISGQQYILTAEVINTALGITLEAGQNFATLANDDTLKKLFLKIGYAGPILEEGTTKWYPTGEMDRTHLRKEWSMIFDVMVKAFSTKSTGWNGIPSYIKKLTHSLVHGYKVNVGALLMAHIRAAIGKKHMVDQVSNLDYPLPSGYDSFSLENETELDPNSVNPHSTPYTQPRTSRLPKAQREAFQEGDTAPSATNKEDSQTEPTVVPPEPKKKRARRTKTTVSHPAVSQKTVEETREIHSSLDVPSQQGTSIEIGLSPKAPCTESAQTHGSQPEIPPLEETQSELGHSEDFSTPIDGSHVSSVNQPPLSTTLSPSSFPTHSFVSSPQPRERDSPNPSGFDHPSPIMDEPPSSGPQEPISQSEMDTTPPNTELGQSGILSENETANTLSELQGASYLQEDAVTASVAVKDTGNATVLATAAVIGGEKDTVTTEPTVTPHPKVAVMPEPAVQTPTDSNIPTQHAVKPSQSDFDAVLVEDASDDDLPLAKLLKVHSKSSPSMHVSIAHTHASRLSEGVQKKREIKEKRGEHKNERQPNELAKGEGLEHVQRDIEGAHTIQALGLESQTVRGDEITQKHPESVRSPIASKPLSFPSPPRRLRYGGPSATFSNRIAALEGQCATLDSKLDSLSQLVVDGFAATQLSIQFLTDLVAANSTKGEKVARSESLPIQESGGTQGEPVSVKPKGGANQVSGVKRKARTKGEQAKSSSEQPQDKVEDLVEVELDGEQVLMSKATQDAMQRKPASRHPILPPVMIRKPAPETQETALQKKWREMEEQNKLGKGKGKLPESIQEGLMWSNGTQFDQEEANVLMVEYRESTLHNHDSEFSSLVEKAMNTPSNRPTNTTTLLKDQITSVSVMVNDEKRWAVSIYLTSGISYFITMQLLQSLPAKVLCALKGKIRATQTPFNEILDMQIQNLITQKLPEVYSNPPSVFYRSKTNGGTRRNNFMTLVSPSRMETKSILKVLDGILSSNANPGRVHAVQEIYKMLVLRDKALGAKMKELITRASAKRNDQGGSCLYNIPPHDDDEDGEDGGGEASGNAGNAGGSNSGNTGIQSQNEGNEETPRQEKKDAGATDEEESRILEALEASILRCAIDCINAEKDAVTKGTVDKDTVIEDAVLEDAVDKGTVKEGSVKDEAKATVKPKRLKAKAKAWFYRQKPTGKHKYSGKEKATGFGRNLRKPIQSIPPNSLKIQQMKSKEIKSVEVKLDANQEASEYILWWEESRSAKIDKDFNLVATSTKNSTSTIDKRRIDFFYLERMVELLESYDNVSEAVMEHVLKYQADRDAEFYQKFGYNFADFDDADILTDLPASPIPYHWYYEFHDLPTEEGQAQPTQKGQPKPSKGPESSEYSQTQSELDKKEAELLEKHKASNKAESEAPNYQPYMLENPLRVKFLKEEIYVCSLHKLKTSTLKDLQYMVAGSIHPLEQICSDEIEKLLEGRKGEDSKLDKQRRKSLNAYPGSRFKLINEELHFRTYPYDIEQWLNLRDVSSLISPSIKKIIDEVEDDAVSAAEISLVESLRGCLAEALKREDVARQKRRSQANCDSKITRRQNVASHDSIFTLTTTLAEDYATATIALDSKFGILDSTLCGELILSPKDHSCDSKLCGKSNCLNKDPYARRDAVSLSCTKSARLRQKLQALQTKANQFKSKVNATAGTEAEKEVTSSSRAKLLKPTCSKLLKQSSKSGACGSVSDYLEM